MAMNIGINIENSDHRWLNESEKYRIRINSPYIVDCLDVNNGLLVELCATDVITNVHRTSIRNQRTENEQSEELLQILKRRSFGQYKQFLMCLRLTNQEHIANTLEADGAVASVEVSVETLKLALSGDLSDVQLEDFIVESFKGLSAKSVRKRVISKLLAMPDTELVGVTKGHSVRFYLLCLTQEALHRIRQLMDSNKLLCTIQSLCNYLSSNETYIGKDSYQIHIKRIYLVHYCLCQQYFIDRECDSNEKQAASNVTMHILPNELLEKIAMKSFVLIHARISKVTLNPEPVVYKTLASVCSTWRQTVFNRRWFARSLRQQLAIKGDVRVEHIKRFKTRGGHRVYGMTKSANRIYIATNLSNVLQVFDSQTYNRLTDIVVEVKGVKEVHAWDIAACNLTKSLYISDFNNECIWRLSENDSKVERWLDRSVWSALSVTASGQILLLGDRPPKLQIYGSDAGLQHDISLPRHMKDPQHVVETASGSYIISHGYIIRWTDPTPVHRVCEISKEGQLLRSYGSKQGEGEGQLGHPLYIATDSDQHVFVADWKNHRVIVLDSLLEHCKTIQTNSLMYVANGSGGGSSDGEGDCDCLISNGNDESDRNSDCNSLSIGNDKGGDGPRRLYYSRNSRRLLIGLASGHVDVYQILP